MSGLPSPFDEPTPVLRDCEYHGLTAHIPDPDDEALVICQACETERAVSMAEARRSWKPEVVQPEEGEPGYRCPSCGRLYDSKMRSARDRVCFECRYSVDPTREPE